MTETEIADLLFEADTGRIATIGADGPLITPLSFVYHNNNIYIHSRPIGKKLDNIKNDSRVCFEVDKTTLNGQDNVRWKSVIIHGTAKHITNADEIMNALSAMKLKSRGIKSQEKGHPESNSKLPTGMLKQLTIIKVETNSISSRINEQLA